MSPAGDRTIEYILFAILHILSVAEAGYEQECHVDDIPSPYRPPTIADRRVSMCGRRLTNIIERGCATQGIYIRGKFLSQSSASHNTSCLSLDRHHWEVK